MNTKRILGIIAIALAVAFVLYQGSSEYLATGRLSQKLAVVVNRFIRAEWGRRGETGTESTELILRKLAHLLEYLFMGTVVFGVVNRIIRRRLFALAVIVLITVPVPVIDEFLVQTRTAGRTPQVLDVMIDLIGIGMAVLIGLFYEFMWRFHEKQRE